MPLKYGLKNNIYYLLKSSAETLQSDYLMTSLDRARVEKYVDFIDVLKQHQYFFFGDAKYFINRWRQEMLRLPSTCPDIHTYICSTLSSFTHYDAFTKSTFIIMRNIICTRLTLFNGRRGGEHARLRMSQWLDRGRWLNKADVEKIPELAKKLFGQ